MPNLKLTLACWDYDRTRALFDGRVKPAGASLVGDAPLAVGGLTGRAVGRPAAAIVGCVFAAGLTGRVLERRLVLDRPRVVDVELDMLAGKRRRGHRRRALQRKHARRSRAEAGRRANCDVREID